MKDENKFENKHAIYYGKWPEDECPDDYIGETESRIAEGIKDHKGKDISSYLLEHSIEFGHRKITKRNFTFVSNDFKINIMTRRIAESLITKQKK